MANTFAGRWLRSARAEYLDHLLIAGETHLRRVLAAHIAHYNDARPHQGSTSAARRRTRSLCSKVRCGGAAAWAASSMSTIATRRSHLLPRE
jgi:hypothetical protein